MSMDLVPRCKGIPVLALTGLKVRARLLRRWRDEFASDQGICTHEEANASAEGRHVPISATGNQRLRVGRNENGAIRVQIFPGLSKI